MAEEQMRAHSVGQAGPVRLDYGLKSLQSRPVYVNGKARGTFVLAYRLPKPESEWDIALMTFAADAATEALSG